MWELLHAPHLRAYQDIPRISFDAYCERVATRPGACVRGAVGRYEWLLRSADYPDPIGWVSLRTNTQNPYCGELGYSILREYRSQGYATEAVSALIAAAFSAGLIDKVVGYCLPENRASRKVLTRAGLLELRRVRRGAMVHGRPVDLVFYELDQIAWRRR